MSKITFRADDDLIRQLEEFDASKSEVMREALRAYLDEESSGTPAREASVDPEGTLDDMLVERIDALIAERLDGAFTPRETQDINVNISLDGESDVSAEQSAGARETRKTNTAQRENASDEGGQPCKQCGETLEPSAVYCSNCGNKTSHRLFCDCGDELRSDWGFCPSCGRRTPAADVLGDS
ncbi:double zinc ribbon domain-containing protein [Natronomonas sp. EA1]|uniref:double zinc ribbon domain-containing protein n=1 Tax=Natronomonas sp. EA1 TaxID=3421655 RepID=UPI003EBAA65C